MNIYFNYTTRQMIDWLMEQPGQNEPDNLLDALIVLSKIVDRQQAEIDELKIKLSEVQR